MTAKTLIQKTETITAEFADTGYLVIMQTDGMGETDEIWIAPADIERFIAGIKELAEQVF